MIIFGSTTKVKKIDNGSFKCPNCYGQKYELSEVNRYFTLFFIPLFILRKIKDIVRCEICNEVFNPENVLSISKYEPIINNQSLKIIGNFGKRLFAFIIDSLITIFLSFLLKKLLTLLNYDLLSRYRTHGDSSVFFKFIIIYTCIWFIYGLLFDTFFKGQTIGKMIFHLKVVNIDGNKMNFRNILARNFFKSLLVFIGAILHFFILIISLIIKSRRKTIHDIIGNTNVFENNR